MVEIRLMLNLIMSRQEVSTYSDIYNFVFPSILFTFVFCHSCCTALNKSFLSSYFKYLPSTYLI